MLTKGPTCGLAGSRALATRPSSPVAGGRPGHLHLGPSFACGVTCLRHAPPTGSFGTETTFPRMCDPQDRGDAGIQWALNEALGVASLPMLTHGE